MRKANTQGPAAGLAGRRSHPLLVRPLQRPVWNVFFSLILVIATVGVYMPVRHHEFVNLDDNVFVTENPNIRGGLTWRSVHWALTAGLTHHDLNADYWRPVSFLSHAVDVELFGLRPAGHHLMNVGIHALAAVALFLVLQSMTNAPWRCVFVAAVFALHPLRVESVAWVAERKDVLSGLLFMLTLGAYTRYVRGPFSLSRYLTVFFVFALALMSKPMVVTLPFVLLLLDYWPLGRTRWVPPVVAGTTVTVPPSRLLKEKLPLFALAVASCVVTSWGQRTVRELNLAHVPLGIRMANALLSYAGYIGKLVWPTGLAVWYPLRPEQSAAAVTVAGLGLVGVTGAVIWGARRRPWLVTGWLWYLGMLVPVIGVFQGSGEAMADRFTYLPSIGLTLMLCWSVPARAMERRSLKMITGVAAGAALLACAALSRIQVRYWKDSVTLFRHALDVTRDNWLAHNNLGIALFALGALQEGLRQFETAVQLQPHSATAHFNLADALGRSGKSEEAIQENQQALRLRPDYPEARYNLAELLTALGRNQEAIAQYGEALRLDPDRAQTHCKLGNALARTGRLEDAIAHYERALQIEPDNAETHLNLGGALARLGKPEEAIQQYQEALRIRPDYVAAHNNLANALGRAGKLDEAIRQYEQALRIDPGLVEAHYNLGVTLEKAGRVPEAIQHYEQALRIKPDFTAARNALARLRAGQ
jgi:tetratricopeptide (TPR) repeat protein